MKRLLIGLLCVAAMALFTAPSAAKKPPKPPEPEATCEFDADGVLAWAGHGYLRCRLTANPTDSFSLVFEEVSGGAEVILHPFVAITDTYPHSGDVCHAPHLLGRFSAVSGVFAAFDIDPVDSYGDPTDGNCGEQADGDLVDPELTYALTVSVQRSWGGDGTVQLRMKPLDL